MFTLFPTEKPITRKELEKGLSTSCTLSGLSLREQIQALTNVLADAKRVLESQELHTEPQELHKISIAAASAEKH